VVYQVDRNLELESVPCLERTRLGIRKYIHLPQKIRVGRGSPNSQCRCREHTQVSRTDYSRTCIKVRIESTRTTTWEAVGLKHLQPTNTNRSLSTPSVKQWRHFASVYSRTQPLTSRVSKVGLTIVLPPSPLPLYFPRS